jgi:O-succinylbenzoic acid--CoA ligase
MTAASRPLVRVPVPPGPEGPARLIEALAGALDGTGPAIAPVPTVSATVSNDYVMSILRAVRAADGDPPLESDEVAAVIATSGSTGSPRGVLLTADQLTSLSPWVNGAGNRPQWIAALPVTSMGGLNVLIRALAADRAPLSVSSVGGAGPFTSHQFEDVVDAASRVTDDVRVSLVPAQVARLLADDRGIAALLRCRTVLVGGAALRPSLRAGASALGIPLTTTYGATETAGGCVFDGVPLPGVAVSTEGAPGVLAINGPSVALGYRADPEATLRAFGPWGYRTSDLGEVDGDGRVRVMGRVDDVVVVNGVNVSPTAIERVLDDLPDIVTAAVVAVDDADSEPALHAFIEVREDAPGIEDLGREEIGRRLGGAARPVVHRVARLPHLPNGKVDRRLLQEWSGRRDDED